MKRSKIIKSILIPTLGISAIGTIAAVCTSCGSDKQDKPYVAITANRNSTLELRNYNDNNPNLQYSTDGTSWSTYNTTININQGQTYYLKGNNSTGWSHGWDKTSTLSITGDVSISGNVMGLLDNGAKPGEQRDITNIPNNYCFDDLFAGSSGITSVSKSFLPATSLATYCYNGMFKGCTSLETAPNLPATSLATNCYSSMFQGCTALTVAPKLPATSLADCCYAQMFFHCSSLTTAPNLPATTLADACYWLMFNGCSSLTTAPELPATTLKQGCYNGMFSGCSSFNSIKIGYTGNYNSNYFENWVQGVADSGTFYYNGNQTAQDFKLPDGWQTRKF